MKINPQLEKQILATPGVVVGNAKPPAERQTKPLVQACVVPIRDMLAVTLPIATASEINGRDWRARSRRTDAAWRTVSTVFGPHLGVLAKFAAHYHAGGTLLVAFTRLGGRRLDASNLPTATKATEDAIAFLMGVDDGDPRWRASWEQEVADVIGVRVQIRMM